MRQTLCFQARSRMCPCPPGACGPSESQLTPSGGPSSGGPLSYTCMLAPSDRTFSPRVPCPKACSCSGNKCTEDAVVGGAWDRLDRGPPTCLRSFTAVSVVSRSVVSDSLQPRALYVTHQASVSMRVSRQEYWNGQLSPPPGDRPDPGIVPACLASPAVADGFFTTTWEAPSQRGTPLNVSPTSSLPQAGVAVVPASQKRVVKHREATVTQPETHGGVTGIHRHPWGTPISILPISTSTDGEESSDLAKPLVHVCNVLITGRPLWE